jgi:hypothetical protein
MSTRASAWLAWSLAALSVAMFLASAALYFLDRSAQSPGYWVTPGAVIGELLGFVPFLAFVAFPLVGALIASRHPGNPIGWICLVAGLLWMLILVSQAYSAYGLTKPGSIPFPVTIHALLYAWLWVPTVGLIGIYLLLLFPDGRLPSRRWRLLAWLAGAVIAVESAAVLLTPGPLQDLRGARNPFGLEDHPWVEGLGLIVLPLLPLCMVASAVSLVLRFRRSTGVVREQIKWIAFAASFMGLLYLGIMGTGLIILLISSPQTPNDLGSQSWLGVLLENVMVLSFAGVPVAIGFAVLKYRLYEIDIIINRTLVYGVLTATLVALYFGSVTATQAIFRALSGQEEQPQLAIVVSTLVIATLFNPLRRRVQGFIDRRFYRKKYDAAKTLEAFSGKLRDETDLDALSEDLVGVVRETMQPAHVSLWLRPDTARATAGMPSRVAKRVTKPIRNREVRLRSRE